MDNLLALMDGFATAVQPIYLLYALAGVFVGTAVGVLPGIGPAMTVALLMPLTYSLEPTAAFTISICVSISWYLSKRGRLKFIELKR